MELVLAQLLHVQAEHQLVVLHLLHLVAVGEDYLIEASVQHQEQHQVIVSVVVSQVYQQRQYYSSGCETWHSMGAGDLESI